MYRLTKDMDQDPSQDNRAKLGDGRENTRKLLAEFLRVTPEEIVITRNTSESNNLVSTGIDLKAGDEVLLTADNHPSNHTAWQEKAKRFGFTVKDVPTPNPHPGMRALRRCVHARRSRRGPRSSRSRTRPARSAICFRRRSSAGWRASAAS